MGVYTTYHSIHSLRAHSNETAGAPVTIQMRDHHGDLIGDVTLFVERQTLANRLVEAINRAMDEWRAEQTEEETV